MSGEPLSGQHDPETVSAPTMPGDDGCWNRIGVWGDEVPRCPVLEEVVHCQNCEVFEKAGRALLFRPAPEGYLDVFRAALAAPPPERVDGGTVESIVFRLGPEWLALPVSCLREITEPRPVRTLPNRSGAILRGLVNIRGELQMAIALEALLGITRGRNEADESGRLVYPRMLVVEIETERWVFEVDEVPGSRPIANRDIHPAPATVARASDAYSRGIAELDGNLVGMLEADLLLSAIRRKVLGR